MSIFDWLVTNSNSIAQVIDKYSVLHLGVGLIFSLTLGSLFTRGILDFATGASKNEIEEDKECEWVLPSARGGMVIGRLETMFFFLSIFWNRPEGIFAWLDFKVLSKWEVWKNIIAIDKEKVSFEKRHLCGSFILRRFLIGSACNILFAYYGYLIPAFNLEVQHKKKRLQVVF
jgi:hypothetical protein